MSQEQPKLTLAEAQWVVDEHNRYSRDIHVCDYEWPVCNAVRFAQALLAYDKALRQARSDLIVAGMFDSAKEVEAVLLPKGEDDD